MGTTLPKDMAERLGVRPGDRLLAVETEQGILLTSYDPLTEEALAIAAAAGTCSERDLARWIRGRIVRRP